jgi:nitrogen fixation/metabolism regulation signal transduction histidine kinase
MISFSIVLTPEGKSMDQNRRKHFFINKPLQIRFMLAVIVPLFLINLVALASLYLGIWSKVLETFSNEQTLNDLVTASRMVEYEQARHPVAAQNFSSLSFFQQTEKLGQRQREIFRGILDETNRSLLWKFSLLLFFLGWGTIFISHKIAGPLFRFSKAFNEVEKGDYRSRVFLRKLDEGHPVAREFNAAMERTDHLLSDIKSLSREKDAPQAVAKIKEKLSTVQTSDNA